MAFVKLDVDILESTLWAMPVERDVFLTSLCMAKPFTLQEPAAQLNVTTGALTGWSVPPGDYGFIDTAGVGILRRAFPADPEGAGKRRKVSREEGMQALHVLGEPESDSRSPEHEGRRLVRVAGGFIVLNFKKYRDKDHTNAERQHRYRARHKASNGEYNGSNTVTPLPVTQAEAEAEEELRKERAEGAPGEGNPKRPYPPSSDEAAWKALAKEAGVEAKTGESWESYRKRICKALAKRGTA